MSLFVILNFEDPDPGYREDRPVQGFTTRKPTKAPAHVTGSAQGTVKGTVAKVRRKETRFGRNTLRHYSCVEIARADKAGTLDRDDVEAIREDCRHASKIYIIMHGKPEETERGFSNKIDGAQQEYTWNELARLAKLLFPFRETTYQVSLIMCYGARSQDYRANHNGGLSENQLKSSFAFKFFRGICLARNVRMTAVTGAVSTRENDGTSVVETEEWVEANLNVLEYKQDKATRDLLKAKWKKAEALYPKEAWAQLCQRFATNPAEYAGNDPLFIFLKRYYEEHVHRKTRLLMAKSTATQGYAGASNIAKHGRLVYTYTGGVLTIVNKYGNPNDPQAVPANHILYSGPML